MTKGLNALLPVVLCIFFLLAGLQASVLAQEQITAAELLSRIEASHSVPLPPLIVKAETTSEHRLENSKRPGFDSLTNEEFRTDNEQNEARHWWRRFREDGTLDDGHGMVRYSLKDPRRYVQFQKRPSGEIKSPAFSDQKYMPDLARKYCETLRIGKYLFGDDKPVVETLKTYADLTIWEKLEEVNGAQCYVLEGSGPSGQYKLWIDPANGYNWRKATVHKSGSDLMFGEPMNAEPNRPDNPDMAFPMTMSEDLLVEVSNVQISNIEGHFFVKEAQTTITERHKGGETVYIKEKFVLNDVVYNPDFEALQAFNPPIPSGTPIKSMDFSGVPFKWEDGKVVGGADTNEIRKLDQIIDDAQKPIRKEDTVPREKQAQADPDQTRITSYKTLVLGFGGAALLLAIVSLSTTKYIKSRKSQRP